MDRGIRKEEYSRELIICGHARWRIAELETEPPLDHSPLLTVQCRRDTNSCSPLTLLAAMSTW